MRSFQNIKQLCTLISKQHAELFFIEQLGRETSGASHAEISPITGRENEINEMLKKNNLFGVQGPVTSGMKDKEEKWVEYSTLTQSFNKDAPELKTFLNKVYKSFKIEAKNDGTFNVIASDNEKDPDLIDIANYIISPDDIYALNLSSKKVTKMEAHHKGSASKTQYGVIIEVSIESLPDLDSIAHQLIHLKLPEKQKNKDKIANENSGKVTEFFKKQGYSDLLSGQKVQEERTKALEAFESLDKDLEQFINSIAPNKQE